MVLYLENSNGIVHANQLTNFHDIRFQLCIYTRIMHNNNESLAVVWKYWKHLVYKVKYAEQKNAMSFHFYSQ